MSRFVAQSNLCID